MPSINVWIVAFGAYPCLEVTAVDLRGTWPGCVQLRGAVDTKQHHGMQRCWFKGSEGEALHAVLCAAGFNLRWLLRAIARKNLKGFFARLGPVGHAHPRHGRPWGTSGRLSSGVNCQAAKPSIHRQAELSVRILNFASPTT